MRAGICEAHGIAASPMSFSIFLLANLLAFGGVRVTSHEQFKRLKEGGSPVLRYNFERAYLEAGANTNCPSNSRAFFFVHINKDGDVNGVKGHLVGLSVDLRSVALKWAEGVLKQMRFRPLVYGTKPSSVEMALTLVCTDGLDQVQSPVPTAAPQP
jgi:hypothetical protein